MPDRAYVFDDGDARFGRRGSLMPCSDVGGFIADAEDTSVDLARGEARDVYVRASADRFLACSRVDRAVTCGEPVTVLLVPRGAGPVVLVPTRAECFRRIW